MRKIVIKSIGIFAALLVSVLGFSGHAFAMPASDGMGHGMVTQATCLNLCVNATAQTNNGIADEDEEDDVSPTPPDYFKHINQYSLELVSARPLHSSHTLKRPSKNPPYIEFNVFRN